MARYITPFSLSLLILAASLPAQAEEDVYQARRMQMVERDIKGRGIADEAVLSAMGTVKRHLFVPSSYRRQSYSDHPLPIGHGQTISQPYIVALMTEKLQVKKGQRILEIGTGSGYQAALLAEMGTQVRTIEIVEDLASSAGEALRGAGYLDVKVKFGDGYFGWEEEGPFDAVIVTAAANHIPPPLLKQLKDGGKLIVPLGSVTYYQTLTLVTKRGEGLDVEHVTGVVFVPMTGKMLEE